MRVLIAPDSFKGSLSAYQAAVAIGRGVSAIFPNADIDIIPMADGGEGTVEALVSATGGKLRRQTVQDPLGRPIKSFWGILGGQNTAVIEMAAASGLPILQPAERDPRITSTFGTGQLIVSALEHMHAPTEPTRCKPKLIIGIGGSATNDGGTGALKALGIRFLDADGHKLSEGGAALQNLAAVDTSGAHPLLCKTEILVACDVDTPLCGERGASAVFGPQKGASQEMVKQLDSALQQYAKISTAITGKDISQNPGAGAAGGLGAGLLFYTPAKLVPGVELILGATDFESRVAKADLVITGEGQTDKQTVYGKAPVGVAKAAKRHGKPVICISGALGKEASLVYEHGIDALGSVVCSLTGIEECMKHADTLLEDASARACRLISIGMKLHCK